VGDGRRSPAFFLEAHTSGSILDPLGQHLDRPFRNHYTFPMAANPWQRFFPSITRGLGFLLILASVFSTALLKWVLIPFVSAIAPEFDENRSMVGLWRDWIRGYELLNIGGHDVGDITAHFGDKTWVEPFIASVKTGTGISCAGGHRDAALAYLTNHRCPEGTDLTSYWTEWWTQHQNETQEEWISQGFSQIGISVALPPNPKDWPALLRVVGQKRPALSLQDWESPDAPKEADLQPDSICYNAFRWLRDSGFDPVTYVLDHSGSLSESERKGLLAYRDWERWSRGPMPGRLAFAPTDDWGWGITKSRRPGILTAGVQGTTFAILAAVALLGAWMVKKGRAKQRHLSTPVDCSAQTTSPADAA
jgi:hypothetical protein